ncbi:MAG: efflux RND transporter periplasmic adaptor subunit [Desulfobacterales bacterium]|nr:efflux RND transporter periplasmic adaptor subunit [Desulfobacterales bacterium]
MTLNNHQKTKRPVLNIFFRIFICIIILGFGLFGMSKLAGLKKPPAEKVVKERMVRVEVMTVQSQDTPVFITGFGEARAQKEVMIAPEVSGRVVEIHPRLDVGETIPGGETLFKIDDTNYQAALAEAQAAVNQFQNVIARLEKQFALDRDRLKTLQRNRDLAGAEFERLRKLFADDNVGTRTGVENAEKGFNIATDGVDQMNQALALYPIQIKEAQSSLASAQARLSLARANLERCRVRAPFNGRVKFVGLEKGQFVSPGQHVLTLADDSALEIQISLDSLDARKWLQFTNSSPSQNTAWFSALKPVSCRIRWTEDKAGHFWKGTLHRVVKFEQKTRTLTVAVRVSGRDVISNTDGRLPLVDGMFCTVSIPGRTLENVFQLPREAVSFENTVHVVIDSRLKTLPVEVARIDGETTYVSAGLKNGDTVITTRLIDPLENSLIDITRHTKGDGRS